MKRKEKITLLVIVQGICWWIFVHFNSSSYTKQELAGGKYVTWQQTKIIACDGEE